LKDYSDDGVATGEYFLLKVSGLCSTHTDHDVKIQSTLIKLNPTDTKAAYSLAKSNDRACEKLEKLGQCD